MTATARAYGLTLATALLLTACAATPPPPAPRAAAPAASSVTGASLGPVLGGRQARGFQLGSSASAVPGNVVAYIDRVQRDLQARVAAGGVEVVRRGNNLLLRLVSGTTFDFNASTVKTQFRGTLDGVARTIADYPATFVDVTGHTDSVGTDAVNQKLSDERAAALADYLSGRGVSRARIATRGYGKTQPVAPNTNEAGRARNRRVEILLSPIVDDDLRRR